MAGPGCTRVEIAAQQQHEIGAHRWRIAEIAVSVTVALRVLRVRASGEVDNREVGRAALPDELHPRSDGLVYVPQADGAGKTLYPAVLINVLARTPVAFCRTEHTHVGLIPAKIPQIPNTFDGL